jgi:predicted nucleic acid-binding protein
VILADSSAWIEYERAREEDLHRLLLRFPLMPVDAPGDFETAARIYRRCRHVGITPRGLIDCLIAAVAMRSGATLLAHDGDLEQVADVIGLTMDPSSGR